MNELLIAIDTLEHANLLIPKVTTLVDHQKSNSTITAVRIIYEGLADLPNKHVDDTAALKRYILESESQLLCEIIAQTSSLEIECLTLWNQSAWQGILHAQEAGGASLIIKQVAEPSNSVYLKTPDDWNLVRHSKVPVLLSQSPWTNERTVFAAIDVYDEVHRDLNLRVLGNARQLCELIDAELHIINVVPNLSVWVGHESVTQDYANLKKDIEQEVTQTVGALCHSSGIEHYQLHLTEGITEVEIESIAATASVLVIGTKARKGVRGYLLGNTAEKILHKVDTDVLAVP